MKARQLGWTAIMGFILVVGLIGTGVGYSQTQTISPDLDKVEELEVLSDLYDQTALKLIRQAESRIVVLQYQTRGMSYSPPVKSLYEEIKSRLNDGVSVTFILDSSRKSRDGKPVNDSVKEYFGLQKEDQKKVQEKQNRPRPKILYANPEKILHSKVLIVDDRYAVIGSQNWTHSAFSSNHELAVYVKSKPFVDRLINRLEETIPSYLQKSSGFELGYRFLPVGLR